eukprot:GHVL01017079.1.p1 GENE.GHVL01017079.1~~GHVL01017079.1.p1  ORF type:complete len:407 (+),score=136.56 GHVL01017079.1:1303-2523(+)
MDGDVFKADGEICSSGRTATNHILLPAVSEDKKQKKYSNKDEIMDCKRQLENKEENLEKLKKTIKIVRHNIKKNKISLDQSNDEIKSLKNKLKTISRKLTIEETSYAEEMKKLKLEEKSVDEIVLERQGMTVNIESSFDINRYLKLQDKFDDVECEFQSCIERLQKSKNSKNSIEKLMLELDKEIQKIDIVEMDDLVEKDENALNDIAEVVLDAEREVKNQQNYLKNETVKLKVVCEKRDKAQQKCDNLKEKILLINRSLQEHMASKEDAESKIIMWKRRNQAFQKTRKKFVNVTDLNKTDVNETDVNKTNKTDVNKTEVNKTDDTSYKEKGIILNFDVYYETAYFPFLDIIEDLCDIDFSEMKDMKEVDDLDETAEILFEQFKSINSKEVESYFLKKLEEKKKKR